ncbi:hypothetical protein AB8B21_05940 [Tardiphaga sp. 866_E4_N2_1]|uniref:hypothetical protein n=1 Tax=unclassified Tardiphaga TaxID=2631404 RepID=UPI003F279EB6
MVKVCTITDRNDLATTLAGMPFAELMEVAKALVSMNEDKEFDRNVKTPLGMAETLTDWADAELTG